MKTYLTTAIFVALCGLISVVTPSVVSAQIFQYPYLSPYTPAYIPQVTTSNYGVFNRDLTLGTSGSDVTALQTFLESRGFLVMPYGVTKGYFGALTQAALARYQVSVGIYPAYGYFDATTRMRVATEYGGGYSNYNNYNSNCVYAYAYNCNNTYPSYQNPFNSNAYMHVVSPNGGETFRPGDLITIQWDAYSFNNTRPFEICLVNYRDDCYRSLGTVYPDTYNRNVTTRFIDSAIPTGDYKIKITGFAGNSYLGGYPNYYSYDVPISDQSDNWFRIVSGSGSGSLEITPSSLPEARVGNYYNQLLRAESYGSYYNDNYYDNNYNNNISWRVISGSLPSGLYIERDYNNYYYNEPYRAYIRGTTYSTGAYNFTVEVSDRYRTATRQYTIVVTN